MWESLLYKLMGRRPPVALQRQASSVLQPGCYGYFSPQSVSEPALPNAVGVQWQQLSITSTTEPARLAGLLIDCRQLRHVSELQQLMALQQQLARLQNQSPILLVNDSVRVHCAEHSACQSGLTGFVRSLAKELGGKACRVNLLDLAGADWSAAEASLQFFLSPASCYVSGQLLQLNAAEAMPPSCGHNRPLSGKTALVTGASRGIGKAIATQLAAGGAFVIGLDLPSASAVLEPLMQSLQGHSITLDLTAEDAPAALLAALAERQLKLDILVHNAGVTRDRTLKNMTVTDWQLVLELNLGAQIRLNDALLGSAQLAEQAAFVSLSSINGLAGQRGQCNYACAKSALTGYIQSMAQRYPSHRFNAVAPGFIRTDMTAKMPWLIREIGQRFNSLGQAGEPLDVAQAVSYLARPDNSACNAQVLRVCGQSLVGA
ncbi:SDR family oxidoreductase [Rheinheimera marina]|uniref:SDR family oxidoreductase n=1 Tax=Rheinheimera marina TaxID=1774958 RepID=A0ABV9JJQ7_9GAMM